MHITETIKTKITKQCDVLVCGGGFAGISASLAAARMGKRVILLEREYMLGGLGTAGLITIYLALCDGMGRQVSFGIAEELLRLSVSMGAEDLYPDNWLDSDDKSKRTPKDKRFEVRYNPHLFAILAEQLLHKEGVEILYGSYAVAVDMNGNSINAVVIENKSGRQAIKAESVVDATGDCDIAHFSGVPTEINNVGNNLAGWYYFLGKNGYDLRLVSFDESKDENGNIKYEPISGKRYTGIDGDEIADIVRISHAATLNDVVKKRKDDESVIPVTIASIPQLRMTRKLVGEYRLHDTEMHKYFDDSIGMVSDWRKRGPVYEVPFRTLYSKTAKNLITAGRCTSVTYEMWDIMRVIPCCAVTGEAAGTAAAMTNDFASLDIAALQAELRSRGVMLHENELL